jgi:hypothetical protein
MQFSAIPPSYVTTSQLGASSASLFSWRYIRQEVRPMFAASMEPDLPVGDVCQIQIPITYDLAPPVFLYYRITNYYQNHRDYVQSFSVPQLRGVADSPESIQKQCQPLDWDDKAKKLIYPCGLVANSVFNGKCDS